MCSASSLHARLTQCPRPPAAQPSGRRQFGRPLSRPTVCAAAARAVVVGGGAGGLAAAGRLARAGLEVTLLEANDRVGGRVQSVELGGGFRFDTGPSLLLLPDRYQEAFQALGSSLEAAAEVVRVPRAAYRVHHEGGLTLDLSYEPAQLAAQLEAVEPGAGAAYHRFLAAACRSLDMGLRFFIEKDYARPSDAAALAGLLPLLPGINPLELLGQQDARLRQYFQDARLRATFSFQALYVGLSPFSAPGVFGLLAATELADGVWYPLGGFQKIRDGLAAAAAACGVRMRTRARVDAIEVDPVSSAVSGVRLSSGERLLADVVLCNRDLPAAYDLLAARPAGRQAGGDGEAGAAGASSPSWVEEYAVQRAQRLGALDYSAGVIAFNWAVGRKVDCLLHHNVFLSGDYQRAWAPARRPQEFASFPNFYVHVPSRTDPSAAPPGCDSVMVLLPVANLQQHPSGDYSKLVSAGRDLVLRTLRTAGAGDLRPDIRQELVITPPDWAARYGLRHGAAFGLAHGLGQLSVFRPASKDGRVGGLYFVGASTRPGNGVPLCLVGARLAAQRVLADMGLPDAAGGAAAG